MLVDHPATAECTLHAVAAGGHSRRWSADRCAAARWAAARVGRAGRPRRSHFELAACHLAEIHQPMASCVLVSALQCRRTLEPPPTLLGRPAVWQQSNRANGWERANYPACRTLPPQPSAAACALRCRQPSPSQPLACNLSAPTAPNFRFQLQVAGLDASTNCGEMTSLFESAGTVVSSLVVSPAADGARGAALIYFVEPGAAAAAVDTFDSFPFAGSFLEVRKVEAAAAARVLAALAEAQGSVAGAAPAAPAPPAPQVCAGPWQSRAAYAATHWTGGDAHSRSASAG